MKTLVTLLTLLAIPFISIAQIDADFWFVAPEITESHADEPILLVLSSQENKPIQVTITMPKQPLFDTITINLAAYGTSVTDLTAFKPLLESDVSGIINNKGLHIEADGLITASYEVTPLNNRDIYALKGSNALGYEFFCPVQTIYNNHDANYPIPARNRIDVVATEDGTIISFELTAAANGMPAGSMIITPIMQAGETYSIVADDEAAASHLGGTKIISNNKLIAVTVSDDSVDYPTVTGWDLIGDQIVPVQNPENGDNPIGYDYIVVKTRLIADESYFILATEDTTNIKIDGAYAGTLDNGQTLPVIISDETDFISSNKRVYLFHVGGFDREMGGALLPSIDGCKGSSRVSFPRIMDESFNINLLVKGDAYDSFYMEYENDSVYHIPPDSFALVPNTPEGENWYYLKRTANTFANAQSPGVPVNQVTTIYNTKSIFQMGIYDGTPTRGCKYGYFSDFKTQSFITSIFETDTIFTSRPDTLILDAGSGFITYEWQDGSTGQTFNVTSDSSQMYYVTVQHIQSCEAITDSIFVNTEDIQPTVLISPVSACDHSSTETISVQLQNNSGNTIPAGEMIEFGIQINDEIPVTDIYVLASDIASNSSVTIDLNAEFDFSATDISQVKLWCDKEIDNDRTNDTLYSTIETYGPETIELGDEITINEIPYVIDAGDSFESYIWHDGSTEQTFTINETNISPTGIYSVTVTNANGCEGSDSKLVHVDIIDWAADDIISPSNTCFDGFVGELSVQISNQSPVPVQQGRTFNIEYSLNNGIAIQEQFTLADSLYPQETFTHTFSEFNGYVPLSNNIAVDINNEDDVDTTNNTLNNTLYLSDPKLTFSSDTIVPEGFPFDLVAPEGFETYEWNNGETGQTLVINNSDTYILTVYDSLGCSDTGSIFIAEPVGIIQNGLKKCEMKIWPNPVYNELSLDIKRKTSGPYTIEIISNNGKLVWRQEYKSTDVVKTIPVTELSKGMYLIRFYDDDEYIIENVVIRK